MISPKSLPLNGAKGDLEGYRSGEGEQPTEDHPADEKKPHSASRRCGIENANPSLESGF